MGWSMQWLREVGIEAFQPEVNATAERRFRCFRLTRNSPARFSWRGCLILEPGLQAPSFPHQAAAILSSRPMSRTRWSLRPSNPPAKGCRPFLTGRRPASHDWSLAAHWRRTLVVSTESGCEDRPAHPAPALACKHCIFPSSRRLARGAFLARALEAADLPGRETPVC